MLFYDLFRHDPNIIELPAGGTLFREGDIGEVMYVLVTGHAEVRLGGVAVEEVGPGSVLGEMAVIHPDRRSATVIAQTDCELVVIDQDRFRFLVEETPNFAIEVMGIMAKRLRQCDERLRLQVAAG